MDVGCGNGSYPYLVDRFNAFGVDLQLDALKIAKKYCKETQFIVASASDLPFRDESFDLVSMWEVIEHMPFGSDIKGIIESRRILFPGASLLLSTPNRHFVSNIMDGPSILLRGHRHYDKEKLTKLINDAGFYVRQCSIRGGLNTLIAMNIFYINKHILNRKTGKMQKIFDKRAKEEFNSEKKGFANIFIAAEKPIQQKT